MAIVFPASPSVNDTFTAGSITYKWDGDKWIGLGVTPADRLIEGSNSLEINASNELIWTGGTSKFGGVLQGDQRVIINGAGGKTGAANTLLNYAGDGTTVTAALTADGAASFSDQVVIGTGSSANSEYGLIAYSNSGSTSNYSAVYARNLNSNGRIFTGDDQNGATRFEVFTDGRIISTLANATQANPLTLQNSTSGGNTQVLIKALANGGGDAFIKFDCGGSDMTVGNFYQGTTNNQLCLGPVGTGAATNNGIRIDGNGLVAIGDNATSKLAGELQVINTTEGQQTNDCLVYLETVGNDWVIRENYNSGSVVSYYNYFLKQGATVGSITYDGTNMIYGTGSDYRLKENVVPLTGAIDTVKLLQPKEFNFISNPDVVVKGFIAHELQEVIPYAVSGEKDGLTRDGEMEPQQVDLSKLVPVLTAALQEALAEIETLKGRLDAAGL